MSEYDDFDFEDYGKRPPDPKEISAKAILEDFFDRSRERVFFSRQVEVQHEDQFFHWITNRAIRDLIDDGTIRGETRALKNVGTIHLLWHRNYRFYKRSAKRLVELVEAYADPNIGGALGLHGETMDGELGRGDMGRCSEYSNYLPLPYFLIGIVNFPNGNFDNFDLRPPG